MSTRAVMRAGVRRLRVWSERTTVVLSRLESRLGDDQPAEVTGPNARKAQRFFDREVTPEMKAAMEAARASGHQWSRDDVTAKWRPMADEVFEERQTARAGQRQ